MSKINKTDLQARRVDIDLRSLRQTNASLGVYLHA